MLFLFLNQPVPGEVTFAVSLLLLLFSLGLSIYEITISVGALNILLDQGLGDPRDS